MPEKYYIIEIDEQNEIRVYFETVRGKVKWFAVVLRCKLQNDKWHNVARYDTDHDTPHLDFNDRKNWLEVYFEEALTKSIADFKINWQKYRRYFKI
jgi:hypothetical protein